jgi:FkbM family methyltransferase
MRKAVRRVVRTLMPESLRRRVVRPLSRATLRAAFGRSGLPVDIGEAGRFRMSPDFFFSGWENFGDRHNSGFHACLAEAKRCMCFLDIGAHIGLYSLPVSRRLRASGQVYAFEPSESNAGYLRKHVRMNSIENIEVVPLIVSDAPTADVLFFEHESGGSALSGLAPFKDPSRYSEVRRDQTSIDEFCSDREIEPDLIKIDVEGAELLVLQGASKTVVQHRPVIFLSVHPGRMEVLGTDVSQIGRWSNEMGYEVLNPEDRSRTDLTSGEFILSPDTG